MKLDMHLSHFRLPDPQDTVTETMDQFVRRRKAASRLFGASYVLSLLPFVGAFFSTVPFRRTTRNPPSPFCWCSKTPQRVPKSIVRGSLVASPETTLNETSLNDTSVPKTEAPVAPVTLSNVSNVSNPILLQPQENNDTRVRAVEFMSPLLKYGYRPAVVEYESGKALEKPLLLYLPGFDGTFLSPFFQFPELDTVFDVRCMTIPTHDRSTYQELKECVIQYLEETTVPVEEEKEIENATTTSGAGGGNLWSRWFNKSNKKPPLRNIYLAGESFGGILALDVALTILQTKPGLSLQGLCLINAATCYDRSRLAAQGPGIARYPKWLYPFGLLKLLPLFQDEFSMDQLLLIFKGQGLPSVVNNATREAYMGRVALSLPFVLPYMDQGALHWRLEEWLEYGCSEMQSKLDDFSKYPNFRTLIVAGEKDATLPSIDEAERLASRLPPQSTTLHVVEGAGHASTCGARVDLTALFRSAFPALRKRQGREKPRTSMSEVAAAGKGPFFGMEPRYDNATIGLNPLRYWDGAYYKRYEAKST